MEANKSGGPVAPTAPVHFFQSLVSSALLDRRIIDFCFSAVLIIIPSSLMLSNGIAGKVVFVT